jgi:hypothetical protein
MTPADRYSALVTYLLAKVQERDWRGVSDAANDLRVIEAQAPDLRNVNLPELE